MTEQPYERHAPVQDAVWIELFMRAEYWRQAAERRQANAVHSRHG